MTLLKIAEDCNLLQTHLITIIGLTEIQNYYQSLEIVKIHVMSVPFKFQFPAQWSHENALSSRDSSYGRLKTQYYKRGKFSILQRGKINPTARQSVHLCCTWSGGHIKWRRCSILCIDPYCAYPFATPFPVGMVGLGYRRVLLCGTFYFSAQNSRKAQKSTIALKCCRQTPTCYYSMIILLFPGS